MLLVSVEDESVEDEVVELVSDDASSVDDDESVLSLGGGPPGPCAKVAWKTPLSSLAWALVSLPEDTSFWMRSSIFVCMSVGESVVLLLLLDVPLDWLDLIAESMSVKAEDSADSSDDEIVPLETSVCSSASSFCSGD